MGLTACFLPKPVVGVNGSGMHTNVSVIEGQQEPLLGSQGRRKDQPVCLGLRGPHPHPRPRSLPAPEFQRQCLSPARSALRSAQPVQGFGYRSRLDGSHPDRQRDERARRSPRRRAGRQSVHGAVLGLQHRHRGRHRQDRQPSQRDPVSPDNIYDAIDHFRKAEWIDTILGEDVKDRYAGSEEGLRRPLPAPAGTVVKLPKVQFHHEVYNQYLWNQF